jgi:hypothetical protein
MIKNRGENMTPLNASSCITNLVWGSKDCDKNKIALQLQSLLYRFFDDKQEITNNFEVVEDLEVLNALKGEIEKWLLEQRYKK